MARLPDPAVREQWSRLIRLHEQSDLTVADFCDLHEVSTTSFYGWRRKARNQFDQQGEFLAVQIGEPPQRPGLTKIRFPCGTQIEIDAHDSQSLRWVVDRLSPDRLSPERTEVGQ